MSNAVMDRIKKESAQRFQHHRVGDFPGTIAKVLLKTINGSEMYEITIQTAEGHAQATLWRNLFGQIEGAAKKNNKPLAEMTDAYFKHMGRIYRLYQDLGLTPPEGNTEVEFENAAYGRLGEFVGKPCTAKVVANQRDPSKGPITYINPPAAGASAAPITSAFEGGNPGGVNLDDIPFMRRLDDA